MNISEKRLESMLSVILDDVESARTATKIVSSIDRLPNCKDLENYIGADYAKKVVTAMKMSSCCYVSEMTVARSPEDLTRYICDLKYKSQEHLVLLSLDSGNKVIKKTVITKGLVNQTPVHPREVFRQAVRDNAVSIVIAHNHPSGQSNPSPYDWAMTRVICDAGRIMQIPVIDHIIVGRYGFTSMCRLDSTIFEKTMENVFKEKLLGV